MAPEERKRGVLLKTEASPGASLFSLSGSASSYRLIFKRQSREKRGLIIDLWTTLSVKLPARNPRLNQACSFLSAEAGITDLLSSCGSPLGFGTCVCFGWKQSRLLKDTQEDSFRRAGTHPFFPLSDCFCAHCDRVPVPVTRLSEYK